MLSKLFKNKKKEQKDLEDYLVDAIMQFEEGNFNGAVKNFQLITNAFPEHPLAHLMLGRSLLELKLYEKAIVALFNHLNIVPESAEAMIYLGLAYYECGELSRAEERFEQALKLRKNSTLVKENLAITRIYAGELEEALAELIPMHKENPNDQNISQLIALTLGRMGKWEAAKHYVSKRKDHDPALSAI